MTTGQIIALAFDLVVIKILLFWVIFELKRKETTERGQDDG